MSYKLALTIIVSIITTILLISIVNVGLSIFLEPPNWEDYCGQYRSLPIDPIKGQTDPLVCTEDAKLCDDGTTVSRDPNNSCNYFPCKSDFKDCQEEYDSAYKTYNQIRYYVFAILGFILLISGLYSNEHMLQWTGLATGGVLLIEGVVTNLDNKTLVFISLIAILLIFGFIARKIIKKHK